VPNLTWQQIPKLWGCVVPKRVVDGPGVWRSEKLARVEPPTFRAEYANLIPLALANGVFECNTKRVWSDVYAFNRPDMPPERAESLLNEFERVKLLFRWTDAEGRTWGYWTGIDKPGRLPGKSRRGTNEPIGPEPPQDELRKFLDSNGFHRALNGNEKLLGLGSGSGSGKNISSKPKDGFDPSVSPKSDGSLPDRGLVDLVSPDVGASSPPPVSGEREIHKAAVQRVWDYHIKSLNRNPKLREFTDDRRRKGLARLEEARRKANGDLEKAEELMKLCVDAMAASAFHMGDNPDKQRYDSWENLFGSQKRLEFWLERANGR